MAGWVGAKREFAIRIGIRDHPHDKHAHITIRIRTFQYGYDLVNTGMNRPPCL